MSADHAVCNDQIDMLTKANFSLQQALVDADAVRGELVAALKSILAHVEDMDVERLPRNQCTLCHTYRMIGHAAITKAEGRTE